MTAESSHFREQLLGRIEFVGFSHEQVEFLNSIIAASGLPTDNVKKIACAPIKNFHGLWTDATGTIRLDPSMMSKTKHQIARVFIHELAHACTPLRQRNAKFFGAHQNFYMHIIYAIAEQSRKTKLLNGYHTKLHLKHVDGESYKSREDLAIFGEETFAILTELRLVEPDTFYKVYERQGKLNGKNPFIPLYAIDRVLEQLLRMQLVRGSVADRVRAIKALL